MKSKLGKNAHGTKYLRDFLLANAALSNDMTISGSSSHRSSRQPSESRERVSEEVSADRPVSRSLEDDLDRELSGSNPNRFVHLIDDCCSD